MTEVLAGRAVTRRPQLHCRRADTDELLAAHYRMRQAVFVAEQLLFDASDVDARDQHPDTLALVGLVDGIPAGTVRIYPLDPARPGGVWQGDRLAVLPEFRTSGVGGPMVRFAVATAGALGGRTMIAHVQAANGTFFRRLGWTARREELYVGRPHLLMDIPLPRG